MPVQTIAFKIYMLVFFMQSFVLLLCALPAQAATTLGGDANGDGCVTIADLATLSSQYKKCSTGLSADFNKDGCVTISDFAVLQANYGKCAPVADYTYYWDREELHVNFDRNEDEEFLRIVQDANGYLKYTIDQAQIYAFDSSSFPYLDVDGAHIKGTTPTHLWIHMGDGENEFFNCAFKFNEFTYEGGDGGDWLRSVDFGNTGPQHFYLRGGHDDFEGQNATNIHVYDEGADTAAFNSCQSANCTATFVFGTGSTGLSTAPNGTTTIYFPANGNLLISDASAKSNTIYHIIPGTPAGGAFAILDGGGTDSFYKHGYNLNVSGTTVSGDMTGYFYGWSAIEHVFE